jgi:hypothetical protein
MIALKIRAKLARIKLHTRAWKVSSNWRDFSGGVKIGFALLFIIPRKAHPCSGSCCRCPDKQDTLLVPLPAAWAGNPTKAFAARTALPLIRWMSPRHFAAR